MESILKLLDEVKDDETMQHSGAAVDALSEALYRDIQGHSAASQSQYQSGNIIDTQSLNLCHQQPARTHLEHHVQPPGVITGTGTGTDPYGFGERQPQQQTQVGNNPVVAVSKGTPAPISKLMELVGSQLDEAKTNQLKSLRAKLRAGEITEGTFFTLMKNIVGDQKLNIATMKMHAQICQKEATTTAAAAAANMDQLCMQSPISAASPQQQLNSSQPSVRAPAPQFDGGSQTFAAQTHQQNASLVTHVQANSGYTKENIPSHNSQDSVRLNQRVSTFSVNPCSQQVEGFAQLQSFSKQQQQHLRFGPSPIPMRGTGGGGNNTGVMAISSTAVRPQPQAPFVRPCQSTTSLAKYGRPQLVNGASRNPGGSFLHMNTLQQHSTLGKSSATNIGRVTSSSVKPELVDQRNGHQPRFQLPLVASKGNVLNQETRNLGVPASKFTASSIKPTMSIHEGPQMMSNSQISAAILPSGNSSKTMPTEPVFGQKRPLETSTPPVSNKKQQVSGGLADHSIEQLNDVTAISGVDISQEEENLFSDTKENSHPSEESQRIAREEEKRLILHRVPLRKKLQEILVKYGVKSISSDVERCLSLCVEERMLGLVRKLIQLSKQRTEVEKSKHHITITSDVRQQILLLNRKAKEEWVKKQSEIERLKKSNEPEGNCATDKEREKEEVNKTKKLIEATAANLAAQAALGGDNRLSKWQLMAEQARQMREASSNAADFQSGRGSQEALKNGHSAHLAAPGRGALATSFPTKVDRHISVKDVIAVLEKEPQSSKSLLIYSLYNKVQDADVSAVK